MAELVPRNIFFLPRGWILYLCRLAMLAWTGLLLLDSFRRLFLGKRISITLTDRLARSYIFLHLNDDLSGVFIFSPASACIHMLLAF